MSEEQRESLQEVIRRESKIYASAKAKRVLLEHTRKSVKAVQMKKAEQAGYASVNAQEREAYASREYSDHVLGLSAAVQEEEEARYMLVLAQIKFDQWKANRYTQAQELRNYAG